MLAAVAGEIGAFAIAYAALQWPAYGAIVALSLARRRWAPAAGLAAPQLTLLICFSGALSQFD